MLRSCGGKMGYFEAVGLVVGASRNQIDLVFQVESPERGAQPLLFKTEAQRKDSKNFEDIGPGQPLKCRIIPCGVAKFRVESFEFVNNLKYAPVPNYVYRNAVSSAKEKAMKGTSTGNARRQPMGPPSYARSNSKEDQNFSARNKSDCWEEPVKEKAPDGGGDVPSGKEKECWLPARSGNDLLPSPKTLNYADQSTNDATILLDTPANVLEINDQHLLLDIGGGTVAKLFSKDKFELVLGDGKSELRCFESLLDLLTPGQEIEANVSMVQGQGYKDPKVCAIKIRETLPQMESSEEIAIDEETVDIDAVDPEIGVDDVISGTAEACQVQSTESAFEPIASDISFHEQDQTVPLADLTPQQGGGCDFQSLYTDEAKSVVVEEAGDLAELEDESIVSLGIVEAVSMCSSALMKDSVSYDKLEIIPEEEEIKLNPRPAETKVNLIDCAPSELFGGQMGVTFNEADQKRLVDITVDKILEFLYISNVGQVKKDILVTRGGMDQILKAFGH